MSFFSDPLNNMTLNVINTTITVAIILKLFNEVKGKTVNEERAINAYVKPKADPSETLATVVTKVIKAVS